MYLPINVMLMDEKRCPFQVSSLCISVPLATLPRWPAVPALDAVDAVPAMQWVACLELWIVCLLWMLYSMQWVVHLL